jgi:general stress protein YciG
MWHFANWCLYGKEEDRAAYKGLSGCYSKEKIIEERLRLAGQMHVDSGHIQEIGRINGKRAMSPGGWLYMNRIEYGRLGYKSGIGKSENRLTGEQLSELAKKTWREGKGLAALTPEQRSEIGKRAGKISGQVNRENKTGVCGIPPEEHSKRMSETNRQKWQCPVCGLIGNAKQINAHMAAEHNLDKKAKIKCNSNH